MTKPENVTMELDGQQTEVCNDDSVQIMEALGWVRVTEEQEPAGALTVQQIRDALTAKGIEIPEGARKGELRALLEASA
jgi:hypothetical protein